jgi:hypothetical protein
VHFGRAIGNTLAPIIAITGLQLGSIIAFAIITETVFQWPGAGALFINPEHIADVPARAACLMPIAPIFVVISFSGEWRILLLPAIARLALALSVNRLGDWLRALDGISVDIFPGEVAGMVGESSAGKWLTGRRSSAFWSRRAGSRGARCACATRGSTTVRPRRCAGCAGGGSGWCSRIR